MPSGSPEKARISESSGHDANVYSATHYGVHRYCMSCLNRPIKMKKINIFEKNQNHFNLELKKFGISSHSYLSNNLQEYFSYFPTWRNYNAPSTYFSQIDRCCVDFPDGVVYEFNENKLALVKDTLYGANVNESQWLSAAEEKLCSESNVVYFKEALIATHAWCNVYTHFLIETIYTLISAKKDHDQMPILVSNKLCINFKKTINDLNLSDNVVFLNNEDLVRVDRLNINPSLYAGTWYNRDAVLAVRNYCLNICNFDTNAQHDRVYISRRNNAARSCVNEVDVAKFMSSKGFHVVFLEDLIFSQQVELFKNAKLIVAAHGSGLANVIFSNSNTNVIEIIPTGLKSRPVIVDRSFWNLASCVGICSYSVFFQTNDVSNDFWELDIDSFARFLNEFL